MAADRPAAKPDSLVGAWQNRGAAATPGRLLEGDSSIPSVADSFPCVLVGEYPDTKGGDQIQKLPSVRDRLGGCILELSCVFLCQVASRSDAR